jgi:hypothetical protein
MFAFHAAILIAKVVTEAPLSREIGLLMFTQTEKTFIGKQVGATRTELISRAV